MAPNPKIAAVCNRRTRAARAVYRERMATSVSSFGAAAAEFKDSVLAFADEPSPHNAGRYLAASELLTTLTREVGTSAAMAQPISNLTMSVPSTEMVRSDAPLARSLVLTRDSEPCGGGEP
jgi:predicted phage gp36 major capsid-like protein